MNEPQENLTALDMLTLQNAKLTSERDQAIRELARISQENAEALQRVEAENERLKEIIESELARYDNAAKDGSYGFIPTNRASQVAWAMADHFRQALKGGK
jgi:ferric-dicitrate binding protein FerR (iron transport regulator)